MEKKRSYMEQRILKKNVLELKKNTYKIKNETLIQKMSLMIKKYGQLKPLIINNNNEIIDGNYYLDALKLAGFKEVDCIEISCSQKELFELKLHFETINFEVDNIKKSEVINFCAKNSFDSKVLHNKINHSIEEINRFIKLNKIDWKQELKKNIQNKEHPKLF